MSENIVKFYNVNGKVKKVVVTPDNALWIEEDIHILALAKILVLLDIKAQSCNNFELVIDEDELGQGIIGIDYYSFPISEQINFFDDFGKIVAVERDLETSLQIEKNVINGVFEQLCFLTPMVWAFLDYQKIEDKIRVQEIPSSVYYGFNKDINFVQKIKKMLDK